MLPVAFDNNDTGRNTQHGTYAQIPEAYRNKPVLSIIRNPFDRYVSIFCYKWHTHSPPEEKQRLLKFYPDFPELGFAEFLDMVDRFSKKNILAAYNIFQKTDIGADTINFIAFYSSNPERDLNDLLSGKADPFLRLPKIHFLRQEYLRDDLTNFLAGLHPSMDIRKIIYFEEDANVSRTSVERDLSQFWTPELLKTYMEKERFFLNAFPEYKPDITAVEHTLPVRTGKTKTVINMLPIERMQIQMAKLPCRIKNSFKKLVTGCEWIFGARLSKRRSTFCSVCGNREVEFLPLPEFYIDNARLHGFEHTGNAEMLSLDAYTCSYCGASDRERIYALWIDQQFKKSFFSESMRVIHFAPEAALSEKLKKLGFLDYKTADLQMGDVDYKVDMMNMPFDDESFDFFICSHVLEHVESDDQAIKELYRITRPGGCGILVAPIILGLESTLEDPSVTDDAGRWRLYGQNDHLRLYAHDDYVKKIRSHGFQVDELGENYFGQEVFRSLGLTSTSTLYVVIK